MKRMMMFLSGLFLAAGCATPTTWLVNSEGRSVLCSATGWGYIGAPMAAASHDHCVSNYKRVGYVELSDLTLGLYLDFSENVARVKRVEPYSSGDRVGIKQGDILKTVDGMAMRSYKDGQAVLKAKHAGDPVLVVVDRDGSLLEFSPTLQLRGER